MIEAPVVMAVEGACWVEGCHKEFDCACGAAVVLGVCPEALSFEVERFIKGLKEGPLKALGFFCALESAADDV